MPKRYIGTKEVLAKPMTRGEYNSYRGWQQMADEDPNEEGYLVEYTDGGQANDPRHVGYITYSPKDVFDISYHHAGLGFRFGLAIEAMMQGKKVAREGWNGKGMFLYYVPAASYSAKQNPLGTMLGIFPDDMAPYRAYIAMKTAQDDIVPWVASQTDILAEDWVLVV